MMGTFRIGNKQGFTLVELALVLVIVGLLITGVLKGEALIENARVKKLVNEKDSVAAAYFTFYDRYGQYPGDESLASAPPGDTYNGNNDGLIAAAEELPLFQDLQAAQILNGNFAANLPSSVYGGSYFVVYNGAQGANVVQFNTIPNNVAEQIDLKYDDGVNTSGTIRASAAYGAVGNVNIYWRL
jgi:prepilin-type N-terminal cleavage/methylation domain-containing protein